MPMAVPTRPLLAVEGETHLVEEDVEETLPKMEVVAISKPAEASLAQLPPKDAVKPRPLEVHDEELLHRSKCSSSRWRPPLRHPPDGLCANEAIRRRVGEFTKVKEMISMTS